MTTSPLVARVQAVVRQIEPLLHGLGPEVQGAVLADLTATWLAGHAPELRGSVYQRHVDVVLKLVPENEKEIFGSAGFPKRWKR